MNNEPPARWSDRKRKSNATGGDRAYWAAVSRARKAKKQARREARKAEREAKKAKSKKPKPKTHFFWACKSARRNAAKHPGLTKAEWEVWSRLIQNIHGLKWYKQVPCGYYILDFYCPTVGLVVEADGPEHYTPFGLAYDQERTAYLERNHGLRVIRYKNDDIYLTGDAVAAEIINTANAMPRITPPPHPPA